MLRTPEPLRRTLIAAAVVALAGCEEAEQVVDRFRDMTPHEVYQASLADAGLAQTALGREWIAASRRALDQATAVSPPFQEEGFITPEQPGAVAYRIHVPRGRRLTVDVGLTTDDQTRVFVDLFRVPEDPSDAARPVLSTDSIPGRLEHAPWRGGDFILRLQPELLRGGRYDVELRLEARLAFPVEGASTRSVLSVWGQERDAGRRSHEGVDIFARRGTPVLAAFEGTAYRVRETPIGGKVVWLRGRGEDEGIRLYYAHLDSQAVRSGQDVHVGDTVGFVGNSGNARTTAPHLHFGVYRRREGAVDPFPFIDPPRGVFAERTADAGRLGAWVRLRDEGIRLRAAPGLRAEVLQDLGRHTPLRVLAASGEWYRVRLPDGAQGFVSARLTEPVDLPVASEVVAAGAALLARPHDTAPVIERLADGAEIPVLGTFNGYLYVRSPAGHTGWMGGEGL